MSAAKYRELHSRSVRTLTQGHLAQHIFFHSLHQSVLPDRAAQIFGVRNTDEFQRLRRAELSPLQISRLYGRSRTQVEHAAVSALRERVRARRSGRRRLRRSGSAAFRPTDATASTLAGAEPLQRPATPVPQPEGIAGSARLRRHARSPANGGRVVFEAYESSIPLAKKNGEINVRVRDGRRSAFAAVSLVDEPDHQAPRSAYNPSVSANGRYVAYESSPGNLNFAKRYGGISVVVRDMSPAGRFRASIHRSAADAQAVRALLLQPLDFRRRPLRRVRVLPPGGVRRAPRTRARRARARSAHSPDGLGCPRRPEPEE